MKFGSFFLFVVICCTACASEKSTHTIAPRITKTYIDPSNVQFDKNNIYVCVSQNWMQTNAICTDEQGFYIIDEQGGWNCPMCGTYNTSSYECRKCDYRRTEN